MILMSLWGNQGDSSLFTIQDMAAMGGEAKSDDRIIVDEVMSLTREGKSESL